MTTASARPEPPRPEAGRYGPTCDPRPTWRPAIAARRGVPAAAGDLGFVRAITGDDFRYLWLAAAAILGSLAVVMVPRHAAVNRALFLLARAVGAVAAGAACAAAAAILQEPLRVRERDRPRQRSGSALEQALCSHRAEDGGR